MKSGVWILTVGLAAAAFVSGGCRADVGPPARRLLKDAYISYNSGDYRGAIRRTDEFLRVRRKEMRDGEAYYLRGLSKDRLGQSGAAAADWTVAANVSGVTGVRGSALLALGDQAWETGDISAAERFYRRCTSQEGGSAAIKACFRLGHVLQRQGRWSQADEWFTWAAGRTGRRLSRLARRRAGARAWTIQVGAFAEAGNSAALVRRLRGEGFAGAARHVRKTSRSVRYIVTVGRYDTYRQATASVAEVRPRHGGAFITMIR